ncbi:basic proline-rich protein-like [Perognathus longimembris pacificus]|uniref:basic proline-rich protein-like n=1 Tax=Perognathus longimembris pacificus TaxID=214514 RepID=UPI002019FBFE|nr:basic proline-rich protein-like [Perognathus longimembris pacificus]
MGPRRPGRSRVAGGRAGERAPGSGAAADAPAPQLGFQRLLERRGQSRGAGGCGGAGRFLARLPRRRWGPGREAYTPPRGPRPSPPRRLLPATPGARGPRGPASIRPARTAASRVEAAAQWKTRSGPVTGSPPSAPRGAGPSAGSGYCFSDSCCQEPAGPPPQQPGAPAPRPLPPLALTSGCGPGALPARRGPAPASAAESQAGKPELPTLGACQTQCPLPRQSTGPAGQGPTGPRPALPCPSAQGDVSSLGRGLGFSSPAGRFRPCGRNGEEAARPVPGPARELALGGCRPPCPLGTPSPAPSEGPRFRLPPGSGGRAPRVRARPRGPERAAQSHRKHPECGSWTASPTQCWPGGPLEDVNPRSQDQRAQATPQGPGAVKVHAPSCPQDLASAFQRCGDRAEPSVSRGRAGPWVSSSLLMPRGLSGGRAEVCPPHQTALLSLAIRGCQLVAPSACLGGRPAVDSRGAWLPGPRRQDEAEGSPGADGWGRTPSPTRRTHQTLDSRAGARWIPPGSKITPGRVSESRPPGQSTAPPPRRSPRGAGGLPGARTPFPSRTPVPPGGLGLLPALRQGSAQRLRGRRFLACHPLGHREGPGSVQTPRTGSRTPGQGDPSQRAPYRSPRWAPAPPPAGPSEQRPFRGPVGGPGGRRLAGGGMRAGPGALTTGPAVPGPEGGGGSLTSAPGELRRHLKAQWLYFGGDPLSGTAPASAHPPLPAPGHPDSGSRNLHPARRLPGSGQRGGTPGGGF